MSEPVGTGGHLVVEGPSSAAELVILNGSLDRVARTTEQFEGDLPVGLYRVAARVGTSAEQKHVAISAGETLRIERGDWTMGFEAVAPLEGSSTASGEHQEMAAYWSRRLTMENAVGPCRLFLFARNVGPPDTSHLDRGRWGYLSLHGADGALLSTLEGEDVRLDARERWMAFTADLAAGGHRLRFGILNRGGTTVLAEMPLWLVPRFELHVFATWLDDCRLPAFTISMVPLGDGFVARDREAQRDTKIAELALDGLQRGRSLVPASDRRKLIEGKLRNPWLGIVGAHAMRLQGADDSRPLADAVGRLHAVLGDHPDVLALKLGLGETVPALAFPPTLRASLGIAQEAAVEGDGPTRGELFDALLTGSLALGPWTAWRADAVPDQSPVLLKEMGGPLEQATGFLRSALPRLREWAADAIRPSDASESGAAATLDDRAVDALVLWIVDGLGIDPRRLNPSTARSALRGALSPQGVRKLAATLRIPPAGAARLVDATVRALRVASRAGPVGAQTVFDVVSYMLDQGARRLSPAAKFYLLNQVRSYLQALLQLEFPDPQPHLFGALKEDALRLAHLLPMGHPAQVHALAILGIVEGCCEPRPFAVGRARELIWIHPALRDYLSEPAHVDTLLGATDAGVAASVDATAWTWQVRAFAVKPEAGIWVAWRLGDAPGTGDRTIEVDDGLETLAAELRIAVRRLQIDARRRIADPADPASSLADLSDSEFAEAGHAAGAVVEWLSPKVAGIEAG